MIFRLVAVTADIPQETVNMLPSDLFKFHNILARRIAEKPFQIQADRAHVFLYDADKTPVSQKLLCCLLKWFRDMIIPVPVPHRIHPMQLKLRQHRQIQEPFLIDVAQSFLRLESIALAHEAQTYVHAVLVDTVRTHKL